MKALAPLIFLAIASLTEAVERKDWWAFQPVKATAVPQPQDAGWAKTDLDRFILAAIEAKGLRPVADADSATLQRRLSFDLTGLPPVPGAASANYGQAVEDLLASPRFGERWGRHWLDVARYGESSGKDENVTFPNAWRYRDYVIAALNADKRYDRFIQEQVAGDLLPAHDESERAQNLIATGFLAVGTKSLNETNPRQFAVDLADEQVSAVSEAVLGLTMGCARCHDHKFDPISQRDYTAMAGIFLSTETRYGTPGGVQGRNLGSLIELPAGARLAVVAKPMAPEDVTEKQARNAKLRADLRRILADRAPNSPNRLQSTGSMSAFDIVRIFTQAAQLDAELANFDATGQPRVLAMGAMDKPVTVLTRGPGPGQGPPNPGRGRRTSGFETIADAPLFGRGDIGKEHEKVPRGLPVLLGPAPEIPAGESGRLELAQWLTSPQNPLTARVIANRVWGWLFGRGLVASADNFGTTGDQPTHPELLDFLAQKFVAEGWSVKTLIREIVTSHVYQLASTDDPAGLTADPEDTLPWRHRAHRLEAEEIRDAMLAASGALVLAPPPGSLIGRAGDGPIGGPRNFALTEEQAAQAESDERSIYLPCARNVPPEVLAVFDFPDGAGVHGAREVTSVPTQALFLMNSAFAEQQSRRLAERVLASGPDFDGRLRAVCQLVFNRPPLATEREAARSFLAQAGSDERQAWTSLARSLFSSTAFRTLN